jgi:uncharacterized membrane protein
VSTQLHGAPFPTLADDEFRPPPRRMVVAVLALVGLLVSAYLTLYKLGYLGAIQCGAGGCEVVQASQYSVLFGLPVAMWGMGAYLVLLAVAMLGVQPRWVDARWVAMVLFGFSAFGVAFSAYLTYLSGAVIGAFCQWCLVSAVTITLIFLAAMPELRRLRGSDRGSSWL